MRLLVRNDLDLSRVSPQFKKFRAAIERDDLRSADLKKLVPTPWYRATLHYDLRRGAYLASFLDNEEQFIRRWGWKGEMQDFMPSTLRERAVR